MANNVLDDRESPRTEGGPSYRNPNIGPGHDRAAGKSADPRGDLRTSSNRSELLDKELGGFDKSGFTKKGGSFSVPARTKSPSDLKGDENSAGSSDDDQGGLYNPGGGKRTRKLGKFWTKRRAAAGGGIAAATVTVIFGGLSIVQGPAQLLQLKAILGKPLLSQENSSSLHVNGLWRWYRTGNIGETRVSYLGSKYYQRVVSQLSAIGVDFKLGSNGVIRQATYDTGKMKKVIPELDGMSREQARSHIAGLINVDEANLKNLGSSRTGEYKFYYNARGVDVKNIRNLAKEGVGQLPDGKVVGAMKLRIIAKYTGLTGLWNPVTKYSKDKINKHFVKSEMRAAAKERQAKLKPVDGPKTAAAKAKVKSVTEGSAGKTAGAALLFTSAMCVAREVADSLPAANRGAIIMPAVASNADKMAVASKIEDGKDVDAGYVGVINEGLYGDKGDSVWESKTLNALYDPTNPSGDEPDPSYMQAFSSDTTAAKIKDSVGGGTIGSVACSPGGIFVQVLGSVALVAAGPFTGGTTWGAAAAKYGAATAATYGVLFALQTFFLDKDTLPVEAFTGKSGGDLMGLAAREAADISSRADGGVKLSDTESQALDRNEAYALQEDYKNKSFFAQMFDPNEYYSPAGKAVRQLDPDPTQNVAMLIGNAGNVFNLLPSVFSSWTPSASAAEAQYKWPANRHGVPAVVRNDPNLQNPYSNAAAVSIVLNDPAGQDYASSIIDRAYKCWGDKIQKGDYGWEIVADVDVNPNDAEYIDAKCDDISDYNWRRMIMFVGTSRTMDALDCFDSESETAQQSCDNLNIGNTAQQEGVSTDAASATVNIEDLGKSSDKIDCAAGTKDLGVVTSRYTGEFKKESGSMKIRLCQIADIPGSGNNTSGALISGGAVVESRVSGAWAALAKKAKDDGVSLSSSSSFRLADSCGGTGDGTGCARPGQSAHQTGWAIDFGDMGGFTPTGSYTSCSGRMTHSGPQWQWMKENAEDFGIKQYSAESWHWDFLPMSNRCGK